MGPTITSFETKPLEECVGLTKKMDRECFPQEMWMLGEELELLLHYKAEATILSRNGKAIGQAVTLPEPAAALILDGVDADFSAQDSGVYSYSEAILPAFQNQGYGALLLQEIAIRMRNRGYTSISAHVRTRFSWNRKRTETLLVCTNRFIYDFWEDPREVVEYQEARI